MTYMDETEQNFLFEGIKKLDDEIIAMVRNHNFEMPEKTVQTACSWLQLDIEYVLKLAEDFDATKDMIIDKIAKSDVCDFVTKEKILFIPITFKPRQGGTNSINIRKIVKIGMKAVKDFRVLKKDIDKEILQNEYFF